MFDPNNPQNSFDLSTQGGFNPNPMGGMGMTSGGQQGGILSQLTPDHIMMLMMMLPQMLQAFGIGGPKPMQSQGGTERTVTSPTDITYTR